jgi:membrane-bound lytic murein transglycosylase MltF
MKPPNILHRPLGLGLCLLLGFSTAATVRADQDAVETSSLSTAPEPALIETLSTDDLPGMLERRLIRVLVSFNLTEFFVDDDLHPRGFEFELMQKYAAFLNEELGKGEIAATLAFIPVPFDRLIPDLLAGKGDIAAALLTVTSERSEQVAFTEPYLENISEILVSNADAPPVARPEDLAGRRVHVLRGSSHVQHLNTLNTDLVSAGLKPVQVSEVDEHLSTEDILNLLNVGVFQHTVADEPVAALWQGVFASIRLDSSVPINQGGNIAWAVRPDNPELLESLNRFVRDAKGGTLLGNVLFERYFENEQWVSNPLDPDRQARLDEAKLLLQEYGDRYGFDWVALLAQAYQESQLDHSKRSPAGAVGIMQIRPSTASDKNVQIENIDQLENNIHAGVKYLAFLRDRYFSEPSIDPNTRMDFTFAAYNAGPARVQKLRDQAKAEGLDPNQWFGHVELVARKQVGRETVQYVRNIHKYYVAYSLMFEQQANRTTAIEQVQ